MSRNDGLTFIAGFAVFVVGSVLYMFVARGTLWAVPAVIVVLCGMALCTVAVTHDKYGNVSTGGIVKVVLYTIGINVAGSALFAIGNAIMRAMR
jgi:hypothetical protein